MLSDLLPMDELAGRRVARNMGIPMSGGVGILVKAFEAELMSSEEEDEAFARIRATGRYVSEHLIHNALDIIHRIEKQALPTVGGFATPLIYISPMIVLPPLTGFCP